MLNIKSKLVYQNINAFNDLLPKWHNLISTTTMVMCFFHTSIPITKTFSTSVTDRHSPLGFISTRSELGVPRALPGSTDSTDSERQAASWRADTVTGSRTRGASRATGCAWLPERHGRELIIHALELTNRCHTISSEFQIRNQQRNVSLLTSKKNCLWYVPYLKFCSVIPYCKMIW